MFGWECDPARDGRLTIAEYREQFLGKVGHRATISGHMGSKRGTAANLAKVEFIMYDPNVFGVGDNFSIVRMVDSELFAGTKAQVEENVALRVLDAAQVHVKSYASA